VTETDIHDSNKNLACIEKKDSFEDKVKVLKEQMKNFKYDYKLKKRLHAELINRFDQLGKIESEESSSGEEEEEETTEMFLFEDLTINSKNENIDEEFETNLKIVNGMKQTNREDLPLVETIKLTNSFDGQKASKEIEGEDLRSLSSIEGSLQGILFDDSNSKPNDNHQQVCSSTPLIHLYPRIGKLNLMCVFICSWVYNLYAYIQQKKKNYL
jgi:hypothetical protein